MGHSAGTFATLQPVPVETRSLRVLEEGARQATKVILYQANCMDRISSNSSILCVLQQCTAGVTLKLSTKKYMVK